MRIDLVGELNVAPTTGVVIATSFRPACNTPGVVAPCFDNNATNVNTLCNQGTSTQVVQCFYATGSGTSQNVESGLQFIHGYAAGSGVTNGPPDVNNVWLDGASLGCSEYFNATTTACGARLNAAIDLGSVMQGAPPVETRTPAHAEVRYKIVYGKTGLKRLRLRKLSLQRVRPHPGLVHVVNFAGLSGQNAIAIRVRLNNTTVTAAARSTVPRTAPTAPASGSSPAPAARRTPRPTSSSSTTRSSARSWATRITSGAIFWLRLSQGNLVSGTCTPTLPADPHAASATNGMHCFYMEMGMRGGLSRTRTSRPSRSTSATRASTSSSTATRTSRRARSPRRSAGAAARSTHRTDSTPTRSARTRTTSSTCPTRAPRGTTGRRFGA